MLFRKDMLYTVTLNPALDRTIWLDRIQNDVTNRIDREERFPGGKGIGVSRVLAELGIYNRALGFSGGFHGAELEALLLGQGIQCDFTSIEEETRSNIIIHEKSTGKQILLSLKGPHIRPEELQRFCTGLEMIEDPTIVSIGGSLPGGVKSEIYRIMIATLRHRGAKVILDAEGDALTQGLLSHPYAIKPNLHELSVAAERELTDMKEIIEAAEELRRKGSELVLVSMGSDGILLVNGRIRLLATPPRIQVKNTVGAGDSAVAGFVYGLTRDFSLERCLRYAVASGTATTLKEGTALAEKDDVMALLPHIRTRPI
jgi:6-phosphofructokinase 2